MSPDNIWQQFLLIFLLPGLVLANNCHGATMQGQVVEIHSGDRITIKRTDGLYKAVKLSGIRVPSPDKSSGRIAKRHLGMLLSGRYVSVEYTTLSPAGVILGRVLHGGSDIALRMLTDGLAVVDRTRLRAARLRRYEQAEATARSRGLGYWQTLQ
jgi:endonuclease YncB( thermonuclease family)